MAIFLLFSTVIFGYIPMVQADSALFDSCNTGINDYYSLRALHPSSTSERSAVGQVIKTPNTGNIYSDVIINISLSKAGTPSGILNLYLYAMDGSYGSTGIPTDSIIDTSDGFNVSTLQTYPSSTWIPFNFSTANLNSSTAYCWTGYLTEGFVDVSNTVIFDAVSGGSGNGGNYFNYVSSAWVADSNIDLCFEAYATEIPTAQTATYSKFHIMGHQAGSTTHVNCLWNISGTETLDTAFIYWNVTGSYTNTSMPLSGTSAWSNFTATLPSAGSIVHGFLGTNNSANQQALTQNFTFVVFNSTDNLALHAENGVLMNDLGEIVTTKGWNDNGQFTEYENGHYPLIGYDSATGYNLWNETNIQLHLDAQKDFGANSQRFQTSVSRCLDADTLAKYKIFAGWLADRNMYMVFTVRAVLDGGGVELPYAPYNLKNDSTLIDSMDSWVDFVTNMSIEFRGYSNVIIDPWNEPHDAQAGANATLKASWQDAMQKTSGNISLYSDMFLLYQYGYNEDKDNALLWVSEYPVTGTNIIISQHIYRDGYASSWSADYVTLHTELDDWFSKTIDVGKPLIIGEIGLNTFVGGTDQATENMWFNNTLYILNEHHVGYEVWWWYDWLAYQTFPIGSIYVPAFESLTANYSAYYFAHANALYTYALEISSVSPENTTYTSSTVPFEVSNTGNETGVAWQINAYLDGVPVGANQTSATGSFTGLASGTYTFAVYGIGDNGAEDYEEIVFTVLLPTYVTEVSIVKPAVTSYNGIVSWEVDTSASNDTGITLQINVYGYLTGTPVGANQTSATGTFTISTTGLYTFAVLAVGANGSTDYETVLFAVYVAESTGEIFSIQGIPVGVIIRIRG